MAFSMLQELGGLGGTPDVGTWDTDNSGNSVLSALENIGVNFAAGAAAVGRDGELVEGHGTSSAGSGSVKATVPTRPPARPIRANRAL